MKRSDKGIGVDYMWSISSGSLEVMVMYYYMEERASSRLSVIVFHNHSLEADVIEKYSNFELRAVIKILQVEGANQNEIHC